MGKWPWQCTTTGLDNSTELRMEKIRRLQRYGLRKFGSLRQAGRPARTVTTIPSPEGWGPPARPPTRTMTTIPLQPGGLRGKKVWLTDGRTDRQMDWTIQRAAWLLLKIYQVGEGKRITPAWKLYVSFSSTKSFYQVYDCISTNSTKHHVCIFINQYDVSTQAQSTTNKGSNCYNQQQ